MISRTLGCSSRKFARLRAEFPAVGLFAQALYPLLVVSSDDFGRQQGDAFTVKHAVWSTAPDDEASFEAALDALNQVNLIIRYAIDGQVYLQIVDFETHQQGLHKRTASKFPNPPELPGISSRTELNRTEQKRTEPPHGGGALAGSLPRDHVHHAVCDPTFTRCVPNAVHTKLANALKPRHGGDLDAAKRALEGWYPTVWATLPADFVMPDAFRFWQGRFDGAFASRDDAPKGPTAPRPRDCRHDPPCLTPADHTKRMLADERERKPA